MSALLGAKGQSTFLQAKVSCSFFLISKKQFFSDRHVVKDGHFDLFKKFF